MCRRRGGGARLGLRIEAAVSVFGRGLAAVQSPGCAINILINVHLPHAPFALDGLVVRSLDNRSDGVAIVRGSPRLQSCAITGPSHVGLQIISAPPSQPVITNCRWGDEGGVNASDR